MIKVNFGNINNRDFHGQRLDSLRRQGVRVSHQGDTQTLRRNTISQMSDTTAHSFGKENGHRSDRFPSALQCKGKR